jgi:phage terminase large subunit-like protein
MVDGKLHGYVLEDRSLKASPDVWAEAVLTAFSHNKADRVVGEANYGGDMVEHTVMQAAKARSQYLRYVSVQATRGKVVRAEPIVAMYEQGRIHHVGNLPGLEDEMVSWVPGETRESPNRCDGLVWALTEVMHGRSKGIWG